MTRTEVEYERTERGDAEEGRMMDLMDVLYGGS